MLAAYHDHADLARILLAYGAEVDRRNNRGQTPLGGVAFKGYMDVTRLLLEAGADVSANNGNGMTPPMFAALFGRTEMLKFLRRKAKPTWKWRMASVFAEAQKNLAKLYRICIPHPGQNRNIQPLALCP